MAILQVRDLDNGVYGALKHLAAAEKRSLSQEVTFILEEYIKTPKSTCPAQTEAFLSLSGAFADESAEKLISSIWKSRKNSPRFGTRHGLFN